MHINSVLGTIDTTELGQVLVHEHVTCADWSMKMNFGKKFFDRDEVIKTAVYVFGEAKKCGISTVVDGTPVNLGRDIPLIREVAKKTGMNFIVSSGFYYQEEPWLKARTIEEIYDFLIGECNEGIAGTGVLPGIMKCAADVDGVTPLMERLLTATGRVAVEKNLPIFCHTAPKQHSGDKALEVLMATGVASNRIILGHSGDTSDVDYLETLLKRGAWLGLDRFGMSDYCDPPYDPNGIAIIVELVARGWVDKLLLSHDTAAYLAFGIKGEPNYENRKDKLVFTRIHKVVIPAIKKLGITDEQINTMLVENPRRFFEGL